MFRENIDLKIILSFTEKYERLHKKGEITDQQLDRILSLIDQYPKYNPREFEAKLAEIFNEN